MALPASEASRGRPAGTVALCAAGAAAAATAAAVLDPELAATFAGVTPPLLVLALAVGALALRWSHLGLPLLVAMVYLNLSQALVRTVDFPSLLQVLVVALAFAAWLKRDTDDPGEMAAQPLTLLLAVWVLLLLATTTWAADVELADARVLEVAKAFVIFALATLLMRDRRRVLEGMAAMLGAAGLLSLLTVVQVALGLETHTFLGLARVKQAHLYGRVFEARVAGPLGDPNFYAQILLLAIPPALLLGLAARDRRARVLAFAVAALATAALLLTYSRGAMLALAVMGAMLLTVLRIRWRHMAAVVAALLLALVLLPDSVTRRFTTIAQILPAADEPLRPDSSFEERKLFMRVAWVMFAANPVLGVGAANYTEQYDRYLGKVGFASRQYEDPSGEHFPHNLLLEVAAETGLVGVALLVATLLVTWRSLRRAERRLADERLRAVALGLRLSLVGFLVSALFLHLVFPRYLFLLFAFTASLERLGRRAAAPEADG